MTTPYTSLNAVNNRLAELGLGALTVDESSALLTIAKRHHFTEALAHADKRQDSLSWLNNVLARAKAAVRADHEQHEPQRVPAQTASPDAPYQNSANAQAPHASPESAGVEPGGNPPATGTRASGDYMSHHVYGSKAALCWQVDQTRGGVSTLRLEAAKSIGERQYDWKNKIAIQLTREELPHVAAVLLGLLTETKGSNHGQGDQAGKGFEIQHQGKNLFVRVFAPNKGACAVPVSPADTFEISGLVMRQLLQDRPWLGGGDVLMLLRATVARMGQGGGQ